MLASFSDAAPHLVALVKKVESHTLPQIDDTIGEFKQSAESANTLVRHIDVKIDPAIEKYEGVAVKAGEVMTNVRDVLGDSKSDIRGLLKNLNASLQAVRTSSPRCWKTSRKRWKTPAI